MEATAWLPTSDSSFPACRTRMGACGRRAPTSVVGVYGASRFLGRWYSATAAASPGPWHTESGAGEERREYEVQVMEWQA